MLEVLEFIIKGAGLLLRLMVESGHLLDVSLTGTGRWVIRMCYPPHWKKRVEYHPNVERAVGTMVWALLAVGVYLLDQHMEAMVFFERQE